PLPLSIACTESATATEFSHHRAGVAIAWTPGTGELRLARLFLEARPADVGAMERSLRQTWLVAAFGAAVCALGAHVGADARWLAAIGDAIFRTHAVPHSIPYAVAPTLAWHDAPALGQLVFHALEASLGDRGLILAQV